MKKTILAVAAVAGLALTAVGQSEKKQEPKKQEAVTSPRDAASGQASGRKGNWDIKEAKGAVTDESQASGNKAKPAAADDWQTQSARETGSGMATGKMQNTSQTQPPSSNTARETGSGMATGKRQHTVTQPNDKPKK